MSGQKTAGKTTAVKMAFEKRSGVVYIDVGPKTRYFSGTNSRGRSTWTRHSRRMISGVANLRCPQEPAIRIARCCRWDISTDTPGSIVQNVGNDMKLLVENARGSVAGIVVLSNSSSVFNLGNDESRKKHLVVDGLAEKEAEEYFDK